MYLVSFPADLQIMYQEAFGGGGGILNWNFSLSTQCSFMEYKNYKVVYRRYASLYFIIGIDTTEVGPHVRELRFVVMSSSLRKNQYQGLISHLLFSKLCLHNFIKADNDMPHSRKLSRDPIFTDELHVLSVKIIRLAK
jgi:hypothetical protein